MKLTSFQKVHLRQNNMSEELALKVKESLKDLSTNEIAALYEKVKNGDPNTANGLFLEMNLRMIDKLLKEENGYEIIKKEDLIKEVK